MRFLHSHVRVLRALSVLAAAAIWATVVSDILVGGIRQSEHQVCHRLNVHRAADDRNALVEWRVDAFAVAHPAQRRLSGWLLVLLRADVDSQTWTPLTPDCEKPGDGRLPVRFSVRQPTPQELTLRAGE